VLSPGKKYRIIRPTTGIHLADGVGRVVSVPTGGVITVLSGPNENGKLHDKGLVYTLWEERTVALFAVDVEERGIEVKQPDSDHDSDKSATA